MKKATCIRKVRDSKNNITAYILKDDKGKTVEVKPKELKEAIKLGKVSIDNLKFTSDDRLITCEPKQIADKRKYINISSLKLSDKYNKTMHLLSEAKYKGMVRTFKNYTNDEYYLADIGNDTTILYIPDDLGYLTDYDAYKYTHNPLESVKGHLIVVGGASLNSTRFMFDNCKAKSIDLSMFNTRYILDMACMFAGCETPILDLSYIDTRKVTDMFDMFQNCKDREIKLDNFDTRNVTDMNGMFAGCQAKKLNLSSFNTRKVRTMCCMFCEARVEQLDLTYFNLSADTDTTNMFYDCKAQVKSTDTKILEELNRR